MATGCVAVPALKRREAIPEQVHWIETRRPGARGANGVVVQMGGQGIPLALVEGDWFDCDGINVHRDALEAFGANKTPRKPNAAEWVGAYAVDTVITI